MLRLIFANDDYAELRFVSVFSHLSNSFNPTKVAIIGARAARFALLVAAMSVQLVLSRCQTVAIASITLYKRIYLALAYVVTLGERGHDVCHLQHLASHGEVVGIEVNKSDVGRRNAQVKQPQR